MSDLGKRVLAMARVAAGQPFRDWPAWSTGEMLAVALVLNRFDVLDELSWTIVEAMDRLDGELSVAELRAIEQELQR